MPQRGRWDTTTLQLPVVAVARALNQKTNDENPSATTALHTINSPGLGMPSRTGGMPHNEDARLHTFTAGARGDVCARVRGGKQGGAGLPTASCLPTSLRAWEPRGGASAARAAGCRCLLRDTVTVVCVRSRRPRNPCGLPGACRRISTVNEDAV